MSLFEIIHISSRGVGGAPERDIRLTISVFFRDYLNLFKGAKLSVFTCIALHSDHEGWANPSLSLIKKETGYTDVGTLSTAVTELSDVRIEGQRVLIVLQKKVKGGRFANNDYLIFPTDAEVSQFEAGTLVRKPRRVAQPNGEKPHTAPYRVLPNTVNANRSIDSSIESESKESSIKDSAVDTAGASAPTTAQKIAALKTGALPLTVATARNLTSDVIAKGGYGMQIGDRYTSITANGVIADQFGDKPTVEQIAALALDLWGMYVWWTNGAHGLSNPTKKPAVISALNQYREHIKLTTLNGGNHASNPVLGASAKPVPPILPKPATAADLPAVRRDGDVPAGRTADRSELRQGDHV